MQGEVRVLYSMYTTGVQCEGGLYLESHDRDTHVIVYPCTTMQKA